MNSLYHHLARETGDTQGYIILAVAFVALTCAFALGVATYVSPTWREIVEPAFLK